MIGIRVDANETIASGHLMRCMAIANAIRSQEECLFILAEDKMTTRLREAGFSYVILQSQYDHMEEELPILSNIISQYNLRWMIVDSYQVTGTYLQQLHTYTKVLYIDDMQVSYYDVSVVLHYSDWLENDTYQREYAKRNVDTLLGMQYVPLRPEFYPNTKFKSDQKHAQCRNIFITTGGTDPYHVVSGMIEEYALLKKEHVHTSLQLNVVMGSMYDNKEQIYQYAQKYDWITVYENISTMGELMRKCDMAVSAGGTTLYELCATALPTVCFSFADNQQEFVEQMGKHQIMKCAGDARKDDLIAKKILGYILEVLGDKDQYRAYQHNMSQLVDVNGTEKIANYIINHL